MDQMHNSCQTDEVRLLSDVQVASISTSTQLPLEIQQANLQGVVEHASSMYWPPRSSSQCVWSVFIQLPLSKQQPPAQVFSAHVVPSPAIFSAKNIASVFTLNHGALGVRNTTRSNE